MQTKSRLINRIAIGLLSLFLITSLTACTSEPVLTAVYVPTPVTTNLSLLCKPVVPKPPPRGALNPELDAYTLALQDAIKECAKQQDEYINEVRRLEARAKTRK